MNHYIIPIFIPHYGCTHQCIFCNQKKITGVTAPVTPELVGNIITQHLTRITKEYIIEVAYYGGSFTALPLNTQAKLLEPAHVALMKGQIHAIRLSTRPDCIDYSNAVMLKDYGVTTIELGVQSLDNKVLILALRGHDEQAVRKAVDILRSLDFNIGIQLMPGLPGESITSLIKTVHKTIGLRPDFVRIYPTIVIAETQLAQLYISGQYTPLSLPEAIRQAALLKLIFANHSISVIRTGLQASEDLDNTDVVLAGPYHPAFGEMVDACIFNMMVLQLFDNLTITNSEIVIYHNIRDGSKIRGVKKNNLDGWYERYKIAKIIFISDLKLNSGELIIKHNNTHYFLSINMLANL